LLVGRRKVSLRVITRLATLQLNAGT
jgi:hypothetical protein